MTVYSYACADCEGMEACPGKISVETEEELSKLVVAFFFPFGFPASRLSDLGQLRIYASLREFTVN